MALRDTWHRTLMYFGLADDEDYEEDLEPYTEPEAEAQHAYSDRPNVRRLSSRSMPASSVSPACSRLIPTCGAAIIFRTWTTRST